MELVPLWLSAPPSQTTQYSVMHWHTTTGLHPAAMCPKLLMFGHGSPDDYWEISGVLLGGGTNSPNGACTKYLFLPTGFSKQLGFSLDHHTEIMLFFHWIRTFHRVIDRVIDLWPPVPLWCNRRARWKCIHQLHSGKPHPTSSGNPWEIVVFARRV
jgi:hypothetical protein